MAGAPTKEGSNRGASRNDLICSHLLLPPDATLDLQPGEENRLRRNHHEADSA
jgi:hypothetical protein